MNLKSLQSVAETYLAMLKPKAAASASKPKWVPASITEENVAAFVQAVTEARAAGTSVVEFNGKKYGIKSISEDASEEDQGLAKKIQDAEVENAPKQASDEVPAEVKEEDAEEIKGDNHDEKEVKADEMPKVDSDKDPVKEEDSEDSKEIKADEKDKDDKEEDEKDVDDDKVEEELSGNQHKLDLNKNGKVDGDDLKKLRGEEKEEDSEEDDMGDESDDSAEGEDEKDEDEKPKMTGEQVMSSLSAAYVKMTEGAPADAEAGPEVMDPATQKMKDDADDETEIVDLLPTAAQDGADKLDSAKKPAPDNSSEALPKVAIVDAPVKLK